MSKKAPSTETLYDWDIDRLVFYIGELESDVARLSKPQPEGTVTVTLTLSQAEAAQLVIAEVIAELGGYAEGTSPSLVGAHDEILGALPKEDEAP